MSKVTPINRTGIFYNPFLEKHLENVAHIEQPTRTRSIYEKLLRFLGNRAEFFVSNEKIPIEWLELAHEKKYIELIMRLRDIKREIYLDPDTVVSENSVECALISVSLCVTATREVMERRLNNAFSLVRPPGHHATSSRAMGFCIFNNVAVAAKVLLREYGLSRVAIVDFDVHHGNGTQDIFYDSDEVLFISTHRYPFYPGSGYFDQIGRGRGIGFTVNIPLPEGSGDNDFAFVYTNIVGKILRKFEPEFLLVSAGFDAHFSDPLGGMVLTDAGFRHITNVLVKSISNGRVVFVLEGGYNVETLPSTVCAVVEEMIAPSEEELIHPTLSENLEKVLDGFCRYLNDYWNIL